MSDMQAADSAGKPHLLARESLSAVPTISNSIVVDPAPLSLSSFTTLRRIATRPLELRDEHFDDQFDDDTLFFDGFRLSDGRIALLGPAFFNLLPALSAMTVTALPSGQQCRFRIRNLERHGQIIVDAPEDTSVLSLHLPDGRAEVPIQPSETSTFAGRRVLFTQSKNNHLHWIRDWICYNRDVHGADAVLLYDNGSTAYDPGDVADMIEGIDGILAARVVNWPFKFGPQGTNDKRFWDSDFCQHGVLEHARWRFLQNARSAHNADMDELMVSHRGRSVFSAAEDSLFGVVAYRGRWIMGTQRTAIPLGDPRRAHRDYETVLRRQGKRKFGFLPYDSAGCPPKWTAVPARSPPQAQWGIHSIFGWLPSRIISNDLSYRHFREISDNWKYFRADRVAFDPAVHEEDILLRRHFQRADW